MFKSLEAEFSPQIFVYICPASGPLLRTFLTMIPCNFFPAPTSEKPVLFLCIKWKSSKKKKKKKWTELKDKLPIAASFNVLQAGKDVKNKLYIYAV